MASAGVPIPPRARDGFAPRRRTKQEVSDAFIARLQARGDVDVSAPGFLEGICSHFERLPTRYALDINLDSLDVLSHKRLLDEARADPVTVSFAVRPVEVLCGGGAMGGGGAAAAAAAAVRGSDGGGGLPSPAFADVSCVIGEGMCCDRAVGAILGARASGRESTRGGGSTAATVGSSCRRDACALTGTRAAGVLASRRAAQAPSVLPPSSLPPLGDCAARECAGARRARCLRAARFPPPVLSLIHI